MLKQQMGRIGPIGPIGLILLTALTPAGAVEVRWDTIFRLTSDPANQLTGYSGQRCVAVDGEGSVYVAWLDQRDVPYQVWGRCYDADTRTWQAETALSNRPANCFRPGIACDRAGSVHLAWHMESYLGPGIWYKRFDAATGSWKPDTLIDTTTTAQSQSYPSIVCVPGSGDVDVAWYGLPDTGMYPRVFLKERHSATGWDSAIQVSTAVVNHDQVSVAAGANGDLAVVWCGMDFGSSHNQVCCRRRVAGTWQDVEQVSDFPDDISQYSPTVAIDGDGAVQVVWHGRPNLGAYYQQIFHRCRNESGWLAIESVSGTRSYDQKFPSIACAAGRCHAVWASQANTDHMQLAYSQRDTDGVWSSPTILTALDSGDVSCPSITCDADSGIHIVWYDASSGNQDVYYLRGFLPGPGIAEGSFKPQAPSLKPGATVLRANALQTAGCPLSTGPMLLDASGRKVSAKVTSLPAGVYFVVPTRGMTKPTPVIIVR